MPEAPNYTNAALVMGAVNLFWIMLVIWVMFGMLTVVAISLILNRFITYLMRSG